MTRAPFQSVQSSAPAPEAPRLSGARLLGTWHAFYEYSFVLQAGARRKRLFTSYYYLCTRQERGLCGCDERFVFWFGYSHESGTHTGW